MGASFAASAAAASASAAAAAAAQAAADAAQNAVKAGAEANEVEIIAEQAATLASARSRIVARRLPAAEAERALHEVWIQFSVPFLHLLDDGTRLRIIGLLKTHKTLSVGEIRKALGLKLSSVSQQLGLLRSAKLVSVRREAQTGHYSLNRVYLKWLANVLAEGLS